MVDDRIVSAPRFPLVLALLVGACGGGSDDSDDANTSPTSGPTTGPTSTAGDSPTGGDATDATDGPMATSNASATMTGPMATTNDTADDTTADDTTTGVGGDPGQWLLTVDNGASPPELVRQDLMTGTTEMVCAFPNGTVYDSIAFTRDGTLYAHNAGQSRIDTINPCNCGFQVVGPTSTGPLVLTTDADDGMYAIEPTLDAFVRVDLQTGLANVVGGLGVDFGGVGAAWSDNLTGVYAIDDTTDQIFSIAEETGIATLTVALSQDVTNAGLAVHPDGTFYACNGTTLYEVDSFSGEMTQVASMSLTGTCTNLTAPRTGIACLD